MAEETFDIRKSWVNLGKQIMNLRNEYETQCQFWLTEALSVWSKIDKLDWSIEDKIFYES